MKFYIVGHTEANHAIYSGFGMFASQYTPHDAQNNINK